MPFQPAPRCLSKDLLFLAQCMLISPPSYRCYVPDCARLTPSIHPPGPPIPTPPLNPPSKTATDWWTANCSHGNQQLFAEFSAESRPCRWSPCTLADTEASFFGPAGDWKKKKKIETDIKHASRHLLAEDLNPRFPPTAHCYFSASVNNLHPCCFSHLKVCFVCSSSALTVLGSWTLLVTGCWG